MTKLDEMPCGCLGHANYEHLCRYPAREAETKSLREQVRTLSAANETLRETVRTREAAEIEAAAEADALRARLAELEADNSYHAKAQCIVDKEAAEAALDTARDAALEEAAQVLDVAPYSNDEEGSLLATQAGAIRALKTQPARRFVEAERVREVLRMHAGTRHFSGEYAINAAAKTLGLSLDEVKETGRARHVCGWNGDPCTPACPAHEVKP